MLRPPAAPMQAPAVYALIPAYARPGLLARALASLREQGPALRGAIVVNNSGDAATARVAADAPIPTTVLEPSCNLGTAGGLAVGLRTFLAVPHATHVWILDDDAVATPGALEAMLAAVARARAEAAAPLLADADDRVSWVPCRLPRKARRLMRRAPRVDELARELGDETHEWEWAIWASLLLSRRAVETVGFPRAELWSQYSDIEYTLRVTASYRGVLVPAAVCRHLPPDPAGNRFDAKLYAALQNGSYVALRLRHGMRVARHLPGLSLRYLRHYRWRPVAWAEIVTAFFKGAVLGRAATRPLNTKEIERRVAEVAVQAVSACD